MYLLNVSSTFLFVGGGVMAVNSHGAVVKSCVMCKYGVCRYA